MKKFIKFFFFPSLLFFIYFTILTYPAIFFFNSHLFADSGDGLQNVWNLWWTKKSLIEMRISPYFSSFIFAPDGTSLWGHTLSLYNGILSLPFQKILNLNQIYNLIILKSFVLTGTFTMLLCYNFTKNYWASFWAGYLFTFSSYHFAHLQGHMNLVSTELIPLFMLLFLLFLQRKTTILAILTPITFFSFF